MGFKESISKFFQRDSVSEIIEKSRGRPLGDPVMSQNDFHSDRFVKGLVSEMSMEQGLLERYKDYEDMDDSPLLSAALNIISDDSTVVDSVRGKSIWADSKDKIVRDIINDCLYRRIGIEDDEWQVVRSLAKYGSVIGEIVVTERGVVGLNYLPVPTVRRLVSDKGDLLGFVQDTSGKFNLKPLDYKNNIEALKKKLEKEGMVFFETWEIVHWRLRSKFLHSLYGHSFLDPARWVFKRWRMLTDMYLIYQMVRSPGRYAYYIDTGDLPPEEAMAEVRKVMRSYKKKKLLNPTTGELEFRANLLSPQDDVFIPTRGGKESTRIETITGPEWDAMPEIEYLRDEMLMSIGIPKSYYGGESAPDRALAQQDVRFARTCMRMQREFKNGLRKVVRVHLAALNIDPDSVEWNLRMTQPSSIFELQQMEVMSSQAGLIETLTPYFPKDWMLKNILHISKDDVVGIVNDKDAEDEKDLNNQARIQSMIQKKYPNVEMGAMDADPDAAPATEDIKVSKKLDSLLEQVKEAKNVSSLALKRVEKIGNISSKRKRRFQKIKKIA